VYLAEECQGCWREGRFWEGWEEAWVCEGEGEEIISGAITTSICSISISTRYLVFNLSFPSS
jgi:hypothetical protein